MSFTLLEQILARDPRKLVRFPEMPVDEALTALRRLEAALREAEAAPPTPAPPVAPPPDDAEGLATAFGGLAT